jgi:peptide deformylase
LIRPILRLGNEALYAVSVAVTQDEVPALLETVQDLHDTLLDFRERHGAGRAIAAPQIGVPKRLIYVCIDKPIILFNPLLRFPDDEMMIVLDDCMSFPHLLVRVQRYRRCSITYYDELWQTHTWSLEGDLSELIQHEYDHLDGILATMRAVDGRAFVER